MDFLDDRLRRKLINRRGRLHVFDRLIAAKTAIVVIDLTQSSLDNVPDGLRLIAPINAVTLAARNAGTAVAWIAPLPPSRWRSAAQAELLFGDAYMQRMEVETADETEPARELVSVDGDWRFSKTGFSAFFPGNCPLPERLTAAGIDTVIIAGVLTDICVAASAKDAYESGYRVLVCADGAAANEPLLHAMALRTLVRGYADVRTSDELIGLLTGGA